MSQANARSVTRRYFAIASMIAAMLVLAPPSSPAASAPDPSLEALFHQLEDVQNPDQAENEKILQQLHDRLPPNDALSRRRYWRAYCWRHDFSDNLEAGLAYAESRLKDVQDSKDLVTMADLTLCAGTYRQNLGRSDEGLKDFNRGVQLARQSGNKHIIADALSARANNESERGDLAKSIIDLLEAQSLFEQLGLSYWAINNMGLIGTAYRRIGDYPRALEAYRQVLRYFAESGDLVQIAGAYVEFGFIYSAQLQHQKALDAFSQSLAYHQRLSDAQPAVKSQLIAYDQANLAQTYLDLKDFDRALKLAAEARKKLDPKRDASYLALLNVTDGSANAGRHNYERALALFRAAEPVIRSMHNTRYLAILQEARATVLSDMGDFRAAYAELVQLNLTHQKLEEMAKAQITSRALVQFESERKLAQNRQLVAEQKLKDGELANLKKVRFLQSVFILLGLAVTTLFTALGVRYVHRTRTLQELVQTDELTGLPNRRHIFAAGEEAIAIARKTNVPFAILVFDIDYFKQINDHYGHDLGDQALVAVGRSASSILRQFDLLGRTGGEEFMVILPHTDLDQAAIVAERIRQAISANALSTLEPGLFVRVSIGAAQLLPQDRDLRDITRRADNALYRAKANGRDRVELDRP